MCFFATDIHGATLGKGGDDSLEKVMAGALSGPDKAELVVSRRVEFAGDNEDDLEPS